MPLAYHTNTPFQNCAFCYILLACIIYQAQPHQSRSTGHGNAWTRSDSTGADEAPAPEATHGRKDTETAPAAEPPQRSSPEAKRQKSQSQHDGSSGDKTAQQTLSPTRAAEIEPEPESQKRGTVDHERRRRQREGKERKEERERRENDSKTPLFSPSHRTPSRSTTRASPAPTDTDSSRNAAFFGSAFVEYAESTEINASFDHTEGGDGSHFRDFSNAKNLALYPLLHASIFFTKHHLSNTPFINDIFHYKHKYLLLQTSLRKNALINAGSSSLDQHAKTHFHNFMLWNMP